MAIKVRDFEVRLTRNKEERKQVRQLRYQVFCLEEGASATEEQHALGEEYDAFDRFAEYMAVFHNGRVVGTYRIIDRNAADKMGGFYTESEFNISNIPSVMLGYKHISKNNKELDIPEPKDYREIMDQEYRYFQYNKGAWEIINLYYKNLLNTSHYVLNNHHDDNKFL